VISDNASMHDENIAMQYQALSDEAIIQLASEGGLRLDADEALRLEMRRRSIGRAKKGKSEMRGFFASLRMTSVEGDRRVKVRS
jgi:hypothetical protein